MPKTTNPSQSKFEVDGLRELEIFTALDEDQLSWFCEHGTRIELDRGDHMFERGQPADYLFLVVTGAVEGHEEVGGEWLQVATTGRGQVTGMLPFSRMTHYPRYTVAAEPSQVLRLDKGDFLEMLNVSPEVGQRLVAEMSDRVRGDVRLEQQREKMIALGRLSAGLAHELNNPAAAIDRAVATLVDHMAKLPDCITGLMRRRLDEAAIAAIRGLPELARACDASGLSTLERAEREDALTSWLEERAIDEPWELASTFADAGLQVPDLERFTADIPAEALGDALVWAECALAAEDTVATIASSSQRISSLIASVKTYSHMDRSSEHKPTDVRVGIDNTLKMLAHKLQRKNVRVERDYPPELSRLAANAGELNQVWTNLIDNAIDAVSEGGQLRIAAREDSTDIVISVIDDGPGIPEKVRTRIFDPFFTTKEVGEGTGLGLDIARRIVRTHRGRIDVESRPGRTEMRVRLPLSASERPVPKAGSA